MEYSIGMPDPLNTRQVVVVPLSSDAT